MTTSILRSGPTAVFSILASLLILATFSGCDTFASLEAESLRLASEQPEQGWTYAEAGDMSAACPTSWTLESVALPTHAWRCSPSLESEAPAGCGLTLYRTRSSNTLDALVDAMRPEIEAYGDRSELINSEPSALGDHPAHHFDFDQTIDGADVRAWYRLSLVDGKAWLAHCVIPQDLATEQQDVVESIFERIQI